MSASLSRDHWKPRETTGAHSQRRLPLLTEAQQEPAREMRPLPLAAVQSWSFSECLRQCLLSAAVNQDTLAPRIPMSKGYMTKFLSGVAETWAKRLVRFSCETGCLAPLQWIADQHGCDVVQRDARAAEIAAYRARLAELESQYGPAAA